MYSPELKQAVGAVRSALSDAGLGLQSAEFSRHGAHRPDADAPLVLVACSGGRDSLALAAVGATVCASLGLRCGAAIIDHQLLDGSASVVANAARQCQGLGLDPVRVRRVMVRRTGAGGEADAREARYRGLAAVARELRAAVVLVAHTRDDQAETVLLGLLRSGGLEAVAGMPPTFMREGIRFLRPLLGMSRRQTTAICAGLRLKWWDDPTNGETAPQGVKLTGEFPLRSKIRHDVLPYLTAFAQRDVAGLLARGAASARRDLEYLDRRAQAALGQALLPAAELRLGAGCEPVPESTAPAGPPDVFDAFANRCGPGRRKTAALDVTALEAWHPAIRLRVIAAVLRGLGVSAHATQIEDVDRLVSDWHGQGAVTLPT